jgi:hypothetical protein
MADFGSTLPGQNGSERIKYKKVKKKLCLTVQAVT